MATRGIYLDENREIVGAAMRVLNAIKPGLDEKVYERVLVLELGGSGHRVDQQKQFPVYYRGHSVGILVPDLVVDEKIIVDAKVVTAFNENHEAQMMGYLAITGLQLAILVNFKYARLQWRRILRTDTPTEDGGSL